MERYMKSKIFIILAEKKLFGGNFEELRDRAKRKLGWYCVYKGQLPMRTFQIYFLTGTRRYRLARVRENK